MYPAKTPLRVQPNLNGTLHPTRRDAPRRRLQIRILVSFTFVSKPYTTSYSYSVQLTLIDSLNHQDSSPSPQDATHRTQRKPIKRLDADRFPSIRKDSSKTRAGRDGTSSQLTRPQTLIDSHITESGPHVTAPHPSLRDP